MACRVELPKETVRTALELALASARRGYNTSKNPQFKDLYEKEVKMWRDGLETLSELPDKPGR